MSVRGGTLDLRAVWAPQCDAQAVGSLAERVRSAMEDVFAQDSTPASVAYLIGRRNGQPGVMSVELDCSSGPCKVASGQVLHKIAREISATAMVLSGLSNDGRAAVMVEQVGGVGGDRYAYIAKAARGKPWEWRRVEALVAPYLSGAVVRGN